MSRGPNSTLDSVAILVLEPRFCRSQAWLWSVQCRDQPDLISRTHEAETSFFSAVTMELLTWPRWSRTTPSPTPGRRRCPWEPGAAAWVWRPCMDSCTRLEAMTELRVSTGRGRLQHPPVSFLSKVGFCRLSPWSAGSSVARAVSPVVSEGFVGILVQSWSK